MQNLKEQLAKECDISQEEVEKVLQFVDKRAQQIISEYWRKDPNCREPDDKEIRKAKRSFKEATGILFLTNYEQYSKEYVRGIGNLVSEAFKPGSVDTPKKCYYQHYDVEFITFCIRQYLTEKERIVLRLRYGMIDGRMRSYAKISRIDRTYSRQWLSTIAHKAERKLLFRWYEKEAKERKE